MGNVLAGPRPPRWRTVRTVARNGSRYLLGSALRNWLRNLGSTAPALGSMSLLLLLLGIGLLAGLVGQNIAATEARDASVLHVYLKDDASADDVDGLEAQLRGDPDIQSVTYVSKSQALARAQSHPGLTQLANASESNPFPATLDVKVRSVNRVGAVDALARQSQAVDSSMPSSYDPSAYGRFQQVLFWVAVIGAAFLLLLAFIAVTVTSNSIRAAILSRRDEIGIMQLVGAPTWMVRFPFVIEGAVTGVTAGAIAALLALAVSVGAIEAGASSFAQIAPGITLQAGFGVALLLLLLGPALGSLSSLGSVRRYLES